NRLVEFGTSRPKSRECLLVLRLRLRYRGLLLHEIGEQRRFLVVAVRYFAKPRLFCLTLICLSIQQNPSFSQLAKLVFDLEQDALSHVLFRSLFLLGRGL